MVLLRFQVLWGVSLCRSALRNGETSVTMTARCNIPEAEILLYCCHCFLLGLNAWFCSDFKLDQPCTFESFFELTVQPTIHRLQQAYTLDANGRLSDPEFRYRFHRNQSCANWYDIFFNCSWVATRWQQ